MLYPQSWKEWHVCDVLAEGSKDEYALREAVNARLWTLFRMNTEIFRQLMDKMVQGGTVLRRQSCITEESDWEPTKQFLISIIYELRGDIAAATAPNLRIV